MLPTVNLTHQLFLPTYMIIISLTYCLSIFWLILRSKKNNLDRQLVLDLCLVIMISGFFGARAFHVLYEAFDYYRENPLKIFNLWQGGFVFYGGFLLAWMNSLIFLKIKKQSWGPWHDLFAPVLAFGYALGRLACLSAGCCYGKPTHLSWGISLPTISSQLLHPTQLYSFFWEILLCFTLLLLEFFRKKNNFLKKPGSLFLTWLLFHSVGRLLMESFRADERGNFLLGQSISTWISFILILLSLYLLKFFK